MGRHRTVLYVLVEATGQTTVLATITRVVAEAQHRKVAVQQVAEVDLGESLHTLMKLSHIHLFGIGLLLFTVGMIFRLAEMRGWIKVSLIALPFAAMLADILAWFLTKQDPVYATVVVIASATASRSFGQSRVRRMRPTTTSAPMKPTAAASVGVNRPV